MEGTDGQSISRQNTFDKILLDKTPKIIGILG